MKIYMQNNLKGDFNYWSMVVCDSLKPLAEGLNSPSHLVNLFLSFRNIKKEEGIHMEVICSHE